MSKEYLISLAINFALFHKQIYESHVKGLLEYMDSISYEELLQEHLSNVDYITNYIMKKYGSIISILLFKFKVGFINLAIGAGQALRS